LAQRKPLLFDVKLLKLHAIDDALFSNPWSIDRLSWSASGEQLFLRYNQRGHQLLRWIGVEIDGLRPKVLLEESSSTFIDYSNKGYSRHAPARDELLWMSERSGFNHLYRYCASTGSLLNAVTQGDWVLRAVERVDETSEQLWFRAMGVYPEQDPYHVHYGRVNFDGSGLVWLTQGNGTHQLEFGPRREFYLDRYSRVDLPPVHELRRCSDGSLVAELGRADASARLAAGLSFPERFSALGRDGKTPIWGVIHRPTGFDSKLSYPVIEQIYAGPHGAFVPKAFQSYHGPEALSELGFIVVQIDGMGTNWRSKAFHDVAWKNLKDAGFPDRMAWLRAAASTRPWMDLGRVGIYGGSAGGQSALRAVLDHPDFYRAAAADCGCHDNRMDKVWWNEAWMGWPIDASYAASSNVVDAHKLGAPLLLTVGELDTNVDPASTMQVVKALIAADKDFELIVFPGAGHGAGGSDYGVRRRRDFFVRHLLGREPRW
jgi:dipeptidyl-peptidase-4